MFIVKVEKVLKFVFRKLTLEILLVYSHAISFIFSTWIFVSSIISLKVSTWSVLIAALHFVHSDGIGSAYRSINSPHFSFGQAAAFISSRSIGSK